MRLLLTLLVLFPLAARAETRVSAHAGSGIEGGTLTSAHPEGVVEAGATLAWTFPGRRWGIALAGERLGRDRDDISNEWKLDVGVAIVNPSRTFHAIIGAGVRCLTLPGDMWTPASTIPGIDLVRLSDQLELVRRGRLAVDVYFDWTFGIYHGSRWQMRTGDVIGPTADFTAITTTYVLGVQTTMRLDN